MEDIAATQRHNRNERRVKGKAIKGLGTILTISGGDDEKTRSSVTERFRSQENLVLVSTDSSAEGLNLHQRCHHLIHLELPFNPNRLEQRNGRIDRYGQTYEPQVKYLFLRGTFEERILLRLIAKYERQRARLTFVPNTLGITTSTDASQARLLKGLMDEDAKLFRDEPTLFSFESEEEPVSDEATAELLEEIDRSLNGYQQAARTHAWLGDAGINADERQVEEADRNSRLRPLCASCGDPLGHLLPGNTIVIESVKRGVHAIKSPKRIGSALSMRSGTDLRRIMDAVARCPL